MIVENYIKTFGEENEHIYSADVLVKWINLVESNIFSDTVEEYSTQYYSREVNKFRFKLPIGVNFTQIVKLYVNGIKYKKVDTREFNKLHTYYQDDDSICIYPILTTSDNSCTLSDLEFTNSTIIGEFNGFKVGDVVNISGCTTNIENNITATIVRTAKNILIFPEDTFTPGVEPGEVTVQKATIKMTYLKTPDAKLVENISTDTLLIPDRFQDIYDYFIMAKISYLQKEFAEFQNHMTMYNTRLYDFEKWWGDNRPQAPESDIIAEEEYVSYRGFDYE